MISRRRFIYCAAAGLMVPYVRGASPIPLGFFKGSSSASSGCSAAATTALNDWVTRVQGQGSDVTIAGTQAAVCTYIDGLMTDGVWSKLVRHNIYAGDGIVALQAPLKNGVSATDVIHSFVGANYSQSTGLTGDFSTKYIATGVNVNDASMGDDDIHFSCYTRTGPDGGVTMEVFQVAGAISNGLIVAITPTPLTVWDCNNQTTGRASYTDASGIGHYIGSRVSSSLSTIYKGGVSQATNTNAGGSRLALEIFIHCQNASGTPGVATARTIEMYSFGTGLTATDAVNFTARYATLRTALGR